MFDIVKIQWKIEHIRCTEIPDSRKNQISLNGQHRENSMENCVHQMFKNCGFIEKFEFIECKILRKFYAKLCALDVQKVQICGKILIHSIYDIEKINGKL